MEEGAGTALLRYHVRVGSGLALQDMHIGPVDAEAVAGIQADPSVFVRADAAARVEGDAAFHTGQVHDDVVGEAAQAYFHTGDGGQIAFLGIDVDELDGVGNPVAYRNDAISIVTHRRVVGFVSVVLG